MRYTVNRGLVVGNGISNFCVLEISSVTFIDEVVYKL